MTIFWILLASLAVAAVIAVLVVRQRRARADARLAEVPGLVLRTTAATSFGLESMEASQVRGTGTLVLTDAEVAFAQWAPDRLIRIPRAAIRQVDTARSHLGKTMNKDLLRIRWASADTGGEDTVAFFISDLDPWLTDLGGTRSTEESA